MIVLEQDISSIELCTKFLSRFLSITSIDDLIKETERAFEELLPMEYSGLYLFNDKKQKLELKMAHGFSLKERLNAEQTAMERHPGYVYRTGQSIYIPDVENDPFCLTLDSKRSFIVRCRLYTPIYNGEKIIGCFGVVSSKTHAFNKADKVLFNYLCTLAGQVYNRLMVLESQRDSELLNRKLSAIAAHSMNAVVITDKSGKIEWVNRSFEKMTGYSLEEVIGHYPGRLLRGTSQNDDVRKLMGEAIKSGKEVSATLTNYAKSGEAYEVSLQILPLFDDNGNVTNFISLQQDVTQQVQSKRELEDQRNRLNAILQTLPDEIYLFNADGNPVEQFIVNETLADGIKNGENKLAFIQLLKDNQKNLIRNNIQKILSGNGFDTLEMNIEVKDSKSFYEIRFSKMDDVHVILLVRDITDRAVLIEERNEQMKLTEDAFSIVSAQNSKLLNFSYIVSHNIRSHSSNISGLIQLMLERRDPVIHNQLIQSLKISSDRLDETLRHLSDLLIIQSKQKVHKEEVQLHELVHKILQTLSLEISVTQATIINKIDNNLIVFNDRTYLESSLLNLISNTIKYRRPDVIPEIIISASETENGIKIAVEDNGLGIDLKANREKVFGMFKTFHQHKASRGIGLFITKNQVEAMGGSIAVDSTPLKGSVFSITLPKSTYSNEVVD